MLELPAAAPAVALAPPHDHDRVESLPLPKYKRMLLGTQEKALAVAAQKSPRFEIVISEE